MRARLAKAKNEAVGITKRIFRRDFSGYTGIAIKNSLFNLSTNAVAKIGSIIFTIIIARMLMPELFGLYSLALSTIVIFSSFSDLGVGTALIQFISKELGKKQGDPGKYYHYILKIKLNLTLIASAILICSAYFIANYYYSKPIFLALVAGSLYLFSVNMLGFFTSLFQAHNDFSKNLIKEVIFQIVRLVLIPITILIFLKSPETILLFALFIALFISYGIALLYLLLIKAKYSKIPLEDEEKKKVLMFIIPLSVTGLSGMFFGYVDMAILGRFVEAQFIGYYQAALALIGSAGSVIGFSGALFPLFSRLKGKKLKLLFKKSVLYTIILSSLGFIAILIFANLAIKIIYWQAYLSSVLILQIFSLILLVDPLINIYSSFFISQNKPLLVAKLLIFSTIINIILNYLIITSLLYGGNYLATVGAAVAVIMAKIVHLSLLLWSRRFVASKDQKPENS